MQHGLRQALLLVAAACLLGFGSNEWRRFPVLWSEHRVQGPVRVPVAVAKRWWAHHQAEFVDLRGEAEYRAGHIAGAVRQSRAARVVYYGGAVSEGYVLEGGLEAWRAAGGPVE